MSEDDLIGQKLGAFTIKSLLGQGGMARVYRAHQHSLDREVALKVIRRIPGDVHDMVARFQREKDMMQKLEHGNILPIYDYASNADYLWIAMRLVEGGTLDDLGFTPDKLVPVVRQLAGALDFAHGLGVIHRDIKPANVLVEKGEHLYLTDFGVAKMLEREGLTAPGTTVGTPEYMSPEQLQGKDLDGRSDQYALAVMAYQFACGKLPFEGSLMEVLTSHMKTPPSSPRKHNPQLPEAAAQAILRALSKNPADRFETTVHFAQALEAGMLGSSASVPTLSAPAGSKSGRPWIWAVLAVPVALLMAWTLRPAPTMKAGPLVFEAHSKGRSEVQWRLPDGTIRSLGDGENARFWPGGKKLQLARGGQWLCLDLASKSADKLLAGVSQADIAPDGSSCVFVKDGALRRQPMLKGQPSGKATVLKEKGEDPSFSPNGEELAFAAESAIWVVNLKSARQRSLSSPTAGQKDDHPCWSPDGKRLVYQRTKDKVSQLRLTQVEGDGAEQVVALPQDCGYPQQPCWSPNSLLAFRTDKGIYQVAPDGTNLRRLVEPPPSVKLFSPEWGE